MALLYADGSPTRRTQINKYEVTKNGIQKNKIELRVNPPRGGDAKPRDQGVF